jgi:hypothetical protein
MEPRRANIADSPVRAFRGDWAEPQSVLPMVFTPHGPAAEYIVTVHV